MSDVDEPTETVKMLRQALRVKLKQDLPNLVTLPKGQIRVASTKTGFRCEVCYKWFQARTTLAMHRKKAHKNAPAPSLVRERNGNFFVCPLCFDPQHSKGIYEHHLKMEHDQALEIQRFIVDTMEEFEEWKKKMEEDTNCRFLVVGSNTKTGIRTFLCNRSGKAQVKNAHLPDSKKRMLRIGSLTRKIGARCPAQVRIRPDEKNAFHVEYCPTHIGHSIDKANFINDLSRPVDLETRKIRNSKRIPPQLLKDPIMREHDYGSWLELFRELDGEDPLDVGGKKSRAMKNEDDESIQMAEQIRVDLQIASLDQLIGQLKQAYSASNESTSNLHQSAQCNDTLIASLQQVLASYQSETATGPSMTATEANEEVESLKSEDSQSSESESSRIETVYPPLRTNSTMSYQEEQQTATQQLQRLYHPQATHPPVTPVFNMYQQPSAYNYPQQYGYNGLFQNMTPASNYPNGYGFH